MTKPIELQFDAAAVANVPHFQQWVGPWAILPDHLQALTESIRSLNLRSHLQQVEANGLEDLEAAHPDCDIGAGDYYSPYTRISDGTAIVSCRGAMMKHRASFSSNASTVMLRQSIRTAAKDPNVSAIMLRIESPGGTVAGTRELGNEVANAAKKKPVHAHFEDLGASAAYWFGSQAARVSANATALVGSIGTFAVIDDYSKAAEMLGVKVHVVKAGEFKGSFQPGTEVTDAQLEERQKLIDSLNSFFLEAVQNGRGLSESTVKSLNDGRVHVAERAKDLSLIDSVESFSESLEALKQSTNSKRTVIMSTETPAKETASDSTNESDKPKASESNAGKPGALETRAELQRYMKAFGTETGAKYFSDGLNWGDACETHIVALDEKLQAETKRADEAEAKLESLALGEEEEIATGAPAKGSSGDKSSSGGGWASLFKERGASAAS